MKESAAAESQDTAMSYINFFINVKWYFTKCVRLIWNLVFLLNQK